MLHHPADQALTPPELPSYLRSIHDLKPIMGVPSDAEMVKIHDVVRVANQVVNVPEIYDPILLVGLSEYLFNAQMAKYRSKYRCSVFPVETIIYTPPLLPNHISVKLEPISGAPSNEQVVRVQEAIRIYHKCSEISPMFDAQLHAELSQHLFDIQMAKYMERYIPSQGESVVKGSGIISLDYAHTSGQGNGRCYLMANDSTSKGDSAQVDDFTPTIPNTDLRDAMEQSYRLAERANQLAERSNRLVEQSKQLVNVGRSDYPVERLDNTLSKISKILVGIQHAIVRNHKANTISALDCLVNGEGETPGVSRMTNETNLSWLSSCYDGEPDCQLPVIINGVTQGLFIDNLWLGSLLCFYGIGKGLCEDEKSTKLKDGMEDDARERLSKYLSSCLG
ncbi:hypothetical protein RSOLAG22IIIB_11189 [Rhizoctonia solani]|uniref:Laminin domain protein n=1 Tax=Rhizoctonia solani TaxID=456999 RepID=A0A0K6G7E2_9AGAM|nr:hypothetical protein RSOLAG22IIIB_11189 [Rhizoctonia solani]